MLWYRPKLPIFKISLTRRMHPNLLSFVAESAGSPAQGASALGCSAPLAGLFLWRVNLLAKVEV